MSVPDGRRRKALGPSPKAFEVVEIDEGVVLDGDNQRSFYCRLPQGVSLPGSLVGSEYALVNIDCPLFYGATVCMLVDFRLLFGVVHSGHGNTWGIEMPDGSVRPASRLKKGFLIVGVVTAAGLADGL